MPKSNSSIRCFEGSAEPHAAFWSWKVLDAVDGGADGGAELSFIGVISEYSWMEDAVTPKNFARDLAKFGKGGPIQIRMHSPGGEIFAAGAIASMLGSYKGKKTVVIDGLCASAAVMVALSADTVKISDTAYMMIHNPYYSALMGQLDAEALKKIAVELETFTTGMLAAYESRTGIPQDELRTMLDAETWMTAAQAVEKGFADEVISGNSGGKTKPTELKNFVNVPGELLNMADEVEQSAADLELERQAQALRDEIDLYKEQK